MSAIKEYEQIVEHSFNPKQECFVVRFLDGSSYVLKISDLPRKITTNSPNWQTATLSEDRTSILVNTNKDIKVIAAHIIHSRGKSL